MNINWLKLDVNILDNSKIKLLRKYPDGDSLFVLWVGLLCLAMRSDIPGHILICTGAPYTPDDLSNILEIPIKTVKMGLELFARFGMIELGKYNEIEILGFRERQSIDKIEHEREQARIRMQRFRDKNKQLGHDVTRNKRVSNETDKIRLDKIRVDKIKGDKSKQPDKIKYRDNVSLTEKEYSFFINNYSKPIVETMLDKMSDYQKYKKKYKDHAAALRNWFRRAEEKGEIKKIEPEQKIVKVYERT